MGDCLFDANYATYGDVDTAAITLRFVSGALATMSFSRRTTYGYDEMIEVFGSRGMLQSERQRSRGVSLYHGASVSCDGNHANWYDRFAPTYAVETNMVLATPASTSAGTAASAKSAKPSSKVTTASRSGSGVPGASSIAAYRLTVTVS